MKRRLYIKLEKIDAVAKKLAKALKGGEIFALIGPLGAGKTTFAKALGKQLKIKHKITSPTFTLSHIYPLSDSKELHHFDFYRLEPGDVVELH